MVEIPSLSAIVKIDRGRHQPDDIYACLVQPPPINPTEATRERAEGSQRQQQQEIKPVTSGAVALAFSGLPKVQIV